MVQDFRISKSRRNKRKIDYARAYVRLGDRQEHLRKQT